MNLPTPEAVALMGETNPLLVAPAIGLTAVVSLIEEAPVAAETQGAIGWQVKDFDRGWRNN